jgi:uncharacterized cupredoxin-like copper-binding protein
MKRLIAVTAPLMILGGAVLPRAGANASALQQARIDTTIVVRAEGPILEFIPGRLAAKAGLRVRLRFINDGLLPHNVVVPNDYDDLDELSTASMQSGSTGYIPMALKDKMLAYTKLASPGDTVDVVFVMPAAGEYTFVCLYPGHTNIMTGTLRSLR